MSLTRYSLLSGPLPLRSLRYILFAVGMILNVCAQSPGTVTVRLEFSNQVSYVDDEPDRAKWALNTQPTPPLPARNFGTVTGVADLVAVNVKPAKGALVCRVAHILYGFQQS